MARVAVFGTGYVGCVTAACLSRDGHTVVGVDIDIHKVHQINVGRSPIAEPGLQELLAQQVAAGGMSATTDAQSAVHRTDLCLVAVGTPSVPDGSSDLRAVLSVMESVGAALRDIERPYTVVVRSTLLPGVLEERLAPALYQAAGRTAGDGLVLCNNPEFLRETTALRDYDLPPFVVVGAASRHDAEVVLDLYTAIDCQKIVTDPRTAAMVKYASNAFHALKIGFANEIGTLARALGANGQEVMEIVCADTQLNISPAYLRPGFAFGGSCLPKDVRALARFAQQQAIRTGLIESILPSNEAHLQRAFEAIRATGARRVGLAGLSFKAGTDDLRESPQVILAEILLGRGHDLRIYDPEIHFSRLVGKNRSYVEIHLPHLSALLVDTAEELYEHAELLVLGTDIADQLSGPQVSGIPVIDLRRDLVVAGSPTEVVV